MQLDPAALSALKNGQRQLDADGCEVGVSRQALDEMIAAYESFSALLPEDAADIVAEMTSEDFRHEMQHLRSSSEIDRLFQHAASLIQSQAARIAELEAGLRGLLDCPDIADNDYKDEETHDAERAARALLNRRAEG